MSRPASTQNLVLPLLAPGRDGMGGEFVAVAEGTNVCPACQRAVRPGDPESHHGWCVEALREVNA